MNPLNNNSLRFNEKLTNSFALITGDKLTDLEKEIQEIDDGEYIKNKLDETKAIMQLEHEKEIKKTINNVILKKWNYIDKVIPEKNFIGWQDKKAVNYFGFNEDLECADLAWYQMYVSSRCLACPKWSKTSVENKKIFQVLNSNGQIDKDQTIDALEYILKSLQDKIPVYVGVNEVGIDPPKGQKDGITNHFIVIVGMGEEFTVLKNKKYYLTYFDNATKFRKKGVNTELNKLYFNLDTLYISGCSFVLGTTYTLTQVRKSEKKTVGGCNGVEKKNKIYCKNNKK